MSEEEVTFDLGEYISHGTNDYEDITWLRDSLSLGDEVTIKIVESDQCDVPIKRKRSVKEEIYP